MKSAILSAFLSSAFGFFSCGGPTQLPSLGVVKPEQLCSEVKRCDVRGDAAVTTLNGRKASPIHLADGQGPESYLGKVAPKRNANSVLKTCGGDITKDDWLETGPTARMVELTNDGKLLLRASLKTHLAEQLLSQPRLVEGQSASIDAIVDAASQGLGLQKVSLLSQTFWLKDSAFERRVGQCGEEEYKNIIYSLTMLRLSELTQKELESKLLTNLEAKLPAPAPTPAESAASGTGEPASEAEAFPPAIAQSVAAPAAVAAPVAEATAPAAAAKGKKKKKGAAAAAEPVPATTPAALPAPAPAPVVVQAPKLDAREVHAAQLRELAYGTVRALASELRTIAALGFDEP